MAVDFLAPTKYPDFSGVFSEPQLKECFHLFLYNLRQAAEAHLRQPNPHEGVSWDEWVRRDHIITLIISQDKSWEKNEWNEWRKAWMAAKKEQKKVDDLRASYAFKHNLPSGTDRIPNRGSKHQQTPNTMGSATGTGQNNNHGFPQGLVKEANAVEARPMATTQKSQPRLSEAEHIVLNSMNVTRSGRELNEPIVFVHDYAQRSGTYPGHGNGDQKVGAGENRSKSTIATSVPHVNPPTKQHKPRPRVTEYPDFSAPVSNKDVHYSAQDSQRSAASQGHSFDDGTKELGQHQLKRYEQQPLNAEPRTFSHIDAYQHGGWEEMVPTQPKQKENGPHHQKKRKHLSADGPTDTVIYSRNETARQDGPALASSRSRTPPSFDQLMQNDRRSLSVEQISPRTTTHMASPLPVPVSLTAQRHASTPPVTQNRYMHYSPGESLRSSQESTSPAYAARFSTPPRCVRTSTSPFSQAASIQSRETGVPFEQRVFSAQVISPFTAQSSYLPSSLYMDKQTQSSMPRPRHGIDQARLLLPPSPQHSFEQMLTRNQQVFPSPKPSVMSVPNEYQQKSGQHRVSPIDPYGRAQSPRPSPGPSPIWVSQPANQTAQELTFQQHYSSPSVRVTQPDSAIRRPSQPPTPSSPPWNMAEQFKQYPVGRSPQQERSALQMSPRHQPVGQQQDFSPHHPMAQLRPETPKSSRFPFQDL